MTDYDLPIKLTAFKLNQDAGPDRSVFLTKIPVGLLINTRDFKVDLWKSEKGISPDQGYQREPTRSRLLRIAKFIAEEDRPLFPTTVLLGSREKLEFNSADGEKGTLTIKRPLWIVDGQHRVYGLRLAINERGIKNWEGKELPVVVLDNFDKEFETLQFFILNQTQKRVPTDLAQRLLRKIGLEKQSSFTYGPGDEWVPKALQIVDLFNETDEKDNVWHARIKLPNTKRLPVNIINQTSFVSSLRPLLKDGALQAILPDKAYQILRNYWASIRNCIPEPFHDPRNYVMQKTPGTFALHDLANRIMINRIAGTNYKIESFQSVLKDVFQNEHGDEVYWRAKGEGAAIFNSMKGFKVLADILERNIPEGKLVGEIEV